jgi:ABC-2 type transport system permease protein
MYAVVTQGQFDSPDFPYIYLGNAFYMYVGAVMVGVSWAVLDDREHYRTLKYIYMAPVNMPIYLMGRGIARFLTTSVGVFITILAGVLFLRVPLDIRAVDWPLFLTTLVVGVAMLALLGLILAGVTLQTTRHSGMAGEAVAGALYLFSGAIFPLEVLPAWLRPIGYILPVTYWLELLRRALVGSTAQAFPTLAGFSNLQLLGLLAGLTVVFGAVSGAIFRLFENRARERGLLDRVSNY